MLIRIVRRNRTNRYINTCIYKSIHGHMCLYIYMCTHAYTYVHMYIPPLYVYVCMHIHIFSLCVCVWIYVHTHRARVRERRKKKDREIYCKGLCHMDMECERAQDLQSASCRLRRDGTIVPVWVQRSKNQGSQTPSSKAIRQEEFSLLWKAQHFCSI